MPFRLRVSKVSYKPSEISISGELIEGAYIGPEAVSLRQVDGQWSVSPVTHHECMTSITIRRLDDGIKARLRVLAARHGRSMEEEARHILKAGVARERMRSPNLAESIRRRVAPIGGVELALPVREPVRRPPKLAK